LTYIFSFDYKNIEKKSKLLSISPNQFVVGVMLERRIPLSHVKLLLGGQGPRLGCLRPAAHFMGSKSSVHKRRRNLAPKAEAGSIPVAFTVTTPLYYVNAGAICLVIARIVIKMILYVKIFVVYTLIGAAPHMGSAYPTIAADVLARFYRLHGSEVKFVTGTDEHGEKIELAAKDRSMEPIEHCNSMVSQYQALWTKVCLFGQKKRTCGQALKYLL